MPALPRRPVTYSCLLTCLALVFGAATRGQQPQTRDPRRPPNLVVLFADDLGWGDLGAYGAPEIRTPHLDRMAAEGQRWTNFYVAAPVCSPSRAALLTGRLPVRSGLYGRRLPVLFDGDSGGMPPAEVTLGEALVGYHRVHLGKWHLGDSKESAPTRHGFDAFFGIPYSNDMRWQVGMSFAERLRASVAGLTAEIERDGEIKRSAYFAPRSELWDIPLVRSRAIGTRLAADRFATRIEHEIVEQPAQQETLTRRWTEEALELIANAAQQPFLLYLAYSMPHVPLFRSADFVDRSRGGRYGDVVEEIDWSVGRILAALHQHGLAEDTLMVFTSDNGPWTTMNEHGGSAGPLRWGKGTTFEGGVRVPAIFWWPGRISPATIHDLGSTLDLLPTLLELTDHALPEGRELDGVSLAATLLAGDASPRTSMPYWRQGELYAWRSGPWKIHLRTQGAYGHPPELEIHDPPLLYHLGRDPGERWDVAADNPAVVERLLAEAHRHRDAVPIAEPLFDRRLASLRQ